MRVLALICARSGSKGLRDKNVRKLGGKSLLARAVELGLRSRGRGEHWSVVVSTESRRYAELARQAGAETPFLRPRALAKDDTRLIAAVLHALTELDSQGRNFDVVVLLSATTPLTHARDVRQALSLWRRRGRASVVSVASEHIPDTWRFELRRGRLAPVAMGPVAQRQTGRERFVLNGAIYVAAPGWLRRYGQFVVAGRTLPLYMPKSRSLDIEDEDDLALAETRISTAPKAMI